MSIKIGIMGYGNLGRGIECAIKQNPDLELVDVFSRRNPKTIKILTDTAGVYSADDVLNKNVVGLHKSSILLDDPYGNIILAGHNNKYVFAKLLKIKIGDEIKITSYIKTYTFKVFKIDIVELDNYDYFKSYDDSKILTLITCYSKNKRFIVLGKVIN